MPEVPPTTPQTHDLTGPATWSGNADELVGMTIGGKYAIESLIAIGGMGAVYRAIQHPLGRTVAIKVLNLRRQKEDVALEFQKRFFREAATCAQLQSAHTVTLYDYGPMEDGHTMFMVLEYVRGRTLRDVLQDEGRLPVNRALAITAQIARSLREAHNLGVVHRDLKPNNVMITVDREGRDQVKVLDFGLAKLMDPETSGSISLAEEFRKAVARQEQSLSVHGVVVGSPGYMAPEQIQGETLTRRTDIYALGCVLFACLGGRPPFRGRNAIDTLMKHLSEPVPRVFEVNPEAVVPDEVEAVIGRCLAKDPGDRYPTVRALLHDLRAVVPAGTLDDDLLWLDTDPPPEQRIAPPPPTARPGGVVWAAAGIGVVAAALLGWTTARVGPGVVAIASVPAGAEVWEDDALVGRTPLVLHGGGERLLEVRLEGYAPATLSVQASGGGSARASVVLKEAP